MEVQTKDRRISGNYTFPISLHDEIERLAWERTDNNKGNKSATAEELVLDGLEYRRSLPDPHPLGQ